MLRSILASLLTAGVLVAGAQQSTTSVPAIETLIRSRDYDGALQTTKAGLHSAPNDFRLWTLEGIILSIKGNNAEAIAAFEKALRISPDYVPALKGEVQLLYQSGDTRAIPLLKRILNADPTDSTAHEMLATLRKKAGDCNDAISQFLLAGKGINSHPESLEAYGYCLVQLQQFQEAAPVFEKLVTLLPQRAYPKYDLAVVLVANKQFDAALKVLDPLLTSDQQDTEVLSLGSQAAEAVGDTPRAVSLLRQAIVLSPTTADYYVAFVAICLEHDSFQVGIDMTNAGLQRIPDNPYLYISRGLLYAQLAEYDKAEIDFARAEQLDSMQILSSYAGDLAEVQRNNPEEALRRVRGQLRAHPDSPLLNFLLAQLLMNDTPAPDSEAFKEAMRSDLVAIKLKPDLVSARDLLASMYMHSGDYERAIEQCRIALQYAPSDETATYHLVISLRHTGQKDELQPLVKRLSELHQQSLRDETNRKRYRLVEQTTSPANQTNAQE